MDIYNKNGFASINGRDDVWLGHITTSTSAKTINTRGETPDPALGDFPVKTVFAISHEFPKIEGNYGSLVLRTIFVTATNKGVEIDSPVQNVDVAIELNETSVVGINSNSETGSIATFIEKVLQYPDKTGSALLWGMSNPEAPDFAIVYCSKPFSYLYSEYNYGNSSGVMNFEDALHSSPTLVAASMLDAESNDPRLNALIGPPENRLRIGFAEINSVQYPVWVSYIDHGIEAATTILSRFNANTVVNDAYRTILAAGPIADFQNVSDDATNGGQVKIVNPTFPPSDYLSNAVTQIHGMPNAKLAVVSVPWQNTGSTDYELFRYNNDKYFFVTKDNQGRYVMPQVDYILNSGGYKVFDFFHRISIWTGVIPKNAFIWILMDDGFRLAINPDIMRELGYIWYIPGLLSADDKSSFYHNPDRYLDQNILTYLGISSEGMKVYTLKPNAALPQPVIEISGIGGDGGVEQQI